MEFYALTWMDDRPSCNLEAGFDEVWNRQMGADSGHRIAPWQAYTTAEWANSTPSGPAIFGWQAQILYYLQGLKYQSSSVLYLASRADSTTKPLGSLTACRLVLAQHCLLQKFNLRQPT